MSYRKVDFNDSSTTLNIDVVDGPPSCLGLYRMLYHSEPRFQQGGDLEHEEDEINRKTLLEEAEKIEKVFNQHGMVEQKDYFRKTVYSGIRDNFLFFYGNTFCIGINTASYFSGNKLYFDCCLGYDSVDDPALNEVLKSYEKRSIENSKEHSSKIYVINKDDNGLNLVSFPVRKSSSEDKGIVFEDLYNEDFFDKSQRIVDFLSSDADERESNGIIILQGKYGTGKTNYLRHMIRTLNKKIIFLPPDLSMELSNPGFVTFLMGHPDSILIIEDAENVLKTREAGGNQAVANLLNMSDGILGDALSIQIVCTLNAESEHIDKALLREGRLIELHEFNELTEDKTASLFRKVYGEDAVPPKKEMTLSQIFKCEDFERRKEEKKDEPGFGFIPPS